jgi:type I restriction enzyme M protein
MFIQSEEFIKEHGGESHNIKLFGQESNPTTWRLAKMNLACRGLKADLGDNNADTFLEDLHPALKADFILANPPFNMSYWGAEKLAEDSRWQYGEPPPSNANLAWVQHIIYHLASDGIAGFVLANGSMSSNTAGEGKVRQTIVEADLVDCIVSLPNQLFYGTSISACLWFIRRNKSHKKGSNRRGQTLFIDARNVGRHVDRTHKELPQAAINRIASAYRAWRGQDKKLQYQDVPGFCKSASLEEIKNHKWALVPGRYVGFDEGLYYSINTEELLKEIKEVEERLEKMSGASHTAIQQLRKLLYG